MNLNIRTDAEADVMIGFCHNGTVATVFMNSLLEAFSADTSRPRRRLIEYQDSAGPYIHDNRARIVTYFLDHTGYQWLWMIDNDIRFPDYSLYTMLDAAEQHNCGILAAGYWLRYGDQNSYLDWLLFSDEGIRALPEIPDSTEPIEVTAVGMGCTLIHRDVLQDVVNYQRENFPDDPWDSFGADLLRFDDGSAQRMGEDVTMCMRARRLGHKAYGLPTLIVDHYKPTFVQPHGSTSALHDPKDAEGGSNGAFGHQPLVKE